MLNLLQIFPMATSEMPNSEASRLSGVAHTFWCNSSLVMVIVLVVIDLPDWRKVLSSSFSVQPNPGNIKYFTTKPYEPNNPKYYEQ